MIRISRLFLLIALVIMLTTMLLFQLVAQDETDTINIADFESSTFDGWTRRSTGSGDWYIYTDGKTPPNPYQTDPNFVFQVPDPPEGEFAAVTDIVRSS